MLILTSGRDYGVQLGEFFRKMDGVKPNLTGFGHLIWEDGKLKGEYNLEQQKFMADEKNEFLLEWTQLRDTNLSFDRLAIQEKLLHCLENRSFSLVSLTNQDTSPENLIINDGRVRMIDPLPVLYSGVVFAGNHVNNYQTLFPTITNLLGT